MKLFRHELFPIWKRFLNVQIKKQRKQMWIEPSGVKTDVTVYNPITNNKVPLILRNKNVCTWYMCGPTVYDSAHVGHACSYVKFDIIQRILSEYFNINVLLIMGITDIDDKIIKRSIESKQDWKELTKFYEEEFFADMKSLNVIKPYMYCRVSEYIPEIIQFIGNILAKGFAYTTQDGSVYFDTIKYGKYGKLAFSESDAPHPIKKSVLDFALWKAAKKGEPEWESPWGYGRPGWHIECSTVASKILGDAIDIHSGGVDLTFPHHENEEAQSCCHHSVEQWVNYWLHTGHLCLKDEKMSKSLQNTISVRDLFKKYTANQFRLFCLLSHYRNGIEFSHETMQKPISVLNKVEAFLEDSNSYVNGKLGTGNIDESSLIQCLNETRLRVYRALADDFNTPTAIHEIVKLVTVSNKMLHQPEDVLKTKTYVGVAAVSNYVSCSLSKLGILQFKSLEENSNTLTNIVENFVNFRSCVRNKALEHKDTYLLDACDTVRKSLSNCGVQIKDDRQTSSWYIAKN